MSALPERAAALLAFWRDAGPARWFEKDEAFDARFRAGFMDDHLAAARREHDGWLDQADSALALLILLDQFPRNAFRGTAHMFATDPLARWACRRVLADGLDQRIEPLLRGFCYLPLMHSESLDDQHDSVALYEKLGGESLPFAIDHRDIIARFGRFPHRNPQLGRESTDEERVFLAQGGFAG